MLILRSITCNSRHNTARSPDRTSGTGHSISPAELTSFVFPKLIRHHPRVLPYKLPTRVHSSLAQSNLRDVN